MAIDAAAAAKQRLIVFDSMERQSMVLSCARSKVQDTIALLLSPFSVQGSAG